MLLLTINILSLSIKFRPVLIYIVKNLDMHDIIYIELHCLPKIIMHF